MNRKMNKMLLSISPKVNENEKEDMVEGQSLPTRTQLEFPPVIFGTSGLGNLFVALEEEVKDQIIKECMGQSTGGIFFDSAGKYGAGLALESLGRSLELLEVKPEEVKISNKLGWFRTALKTTEPTFEPGAWKGLEYDAVQKISYKGIMECFEQGNELLGAYVPQLVSVHDPDEYLAKAQNDEEEEKLYRDILEGYEALHELKTLGKVEAIGVGAKDWSIIEKISKDVALDWVMIANSMTLYHHPEDLLVFMQSLAEKNIQIINSAILHSGFLIGGDYFDYKVIKPDTEEHQALFKWREGFLDLCKIHGVKPVEACAQFSLKVPGVVSIAISTTDPKRVKENMQLVSAQIPPDFWEAMKEKGFISEWCSWVG